MSVITCVAVLAALLCCTARADPQMFRERHRHGNAFRRAVAREQEHFTREGLPTPNSTASWLTMPIFHEDPSRGTFQDKFYYDLTYYDASKPVCMMYLNGEGPLGRAVGGYMWELARNLSACTLTIEHRWYGVSLPGAMTDKKLLTQSLTIDEAMQDVAFLINYFVNVVMANNGGKSITWFLVGGSYSGGMTVWLNEKYPGLFKASWAASGVVRATFAYTDYDGHVRKVTPQDCGDALARIMRITESKWDTDNTRLRGLFGIPAYNTKTDMMWAMADVSASSVQYSMKSDMCNAILPLPEDDWAALQTYATYIIDQWGLSFLSSCYYSTACLSDASMSSQWGPAGYSWVWECCNEVAWWQTGYPGSIRSRNMTTSYFMDQCRSAFYNTTFPDTWDFNKRHHGIHPVTKGYIVATQGSDDPWSTTGLYQSPGTNFPVNTAQCDNCGHCGSMMSPHPSDPVNLQAQRDLVIASLATWLARP